jgi:hypothetical protein
LYGSNITQHKNVKPGNVLFCYIQDIDSNTLSSKTKLDHHSRAILAECLMGPKGAPGARSALI